MWYNLVKIFKVVIAMGVYITVTIFIAFDIVTGLITACYKGNLNSTKLRMGLYHKLSEILTVIGATGLEYGVKYINLNINIPILNVVVTYICIMEMISIMENLGELNPHLGKLFKGFLEKLNGKGETDE